VTPPARPLPVVFVAPGTRWACHCCGECCKGWSVSLSRSDIERLDACDFAARDPQRFGGGYYVEAYDEITGATRPRLRHVGERCIFLDEDERCYIHKTVGPEAKPAICRGFPFRFVALPDGRTEAVLGPECRSWYRSFETGPLVVPDEGLAAVAALDRTTFDMSRAPSVWLVRDRRLLTFEEYRALLEEISAPPPEGEPLESLPARVSRALAAYVGERVPRPPRPPEVAFQRTLLALRNILAANGPRSLRVAIGGMEALASGGAWRRALASLEGEAGRLLRAVFRQFLREGRGHSDHADLVAGVGACLYATLVAAAAAAELMARSGAPPGDAPLAVNIAAKEASIYFRASTSLEVRRAASKTFARLVLEAQFLRDATG
jgi:Fe-S-cluster containining protein